MLETSMKRGCFALPNVQKALGCLLILGWLATAVEGAESWRPWPFNGDNKPGKPDRVIAMWTDTVLTRADSPPVRGFGGRLMFYEGKKETPIKVEGVLVVYAFDEIGRDPDSARPDRKYVITPEQLPAHYSKSKIGHSYSVWIPWDEVGGMQKEITLIVRFEAKNIAPVVGEQHRLLLPGKASQPRAEGAAIANSAGEGGVRRTSYEATVPSENAMEQGDGRRPKRMTTTTMAVPPGMVFRPGTTAAPGARPTYRSSVAPPYAPPSPSGLNRTSSGFQVPRQATSAGSWAWKNSSPPPIGSALDRPRPPSELRAQPGRDRVPLPQRPEGSPSAPESQPGPESANGAPADQPAAVQATN